MTNRTTLGLTWGALLLAMGSGCEEAPSSPPSTATPTKASAAAASSSAAATKPAAAPAASQSARVKRLTKVARAFVNDLRNGKHDAAFALFHRKVAEAMPLEKLAQLWPGIVSSSGPFKQVRRTSHEQKGGFDAIRVTCEFAKAEHDIKIVFDADDKISGLWIVKPKPNKPYKPPEYAKAGSFEERAVEVGEDRWVLPATLTLPKKEGKAAALVLVHGSGPQDRDESVGPNKPFRDLALGLASRGIAVLRYEKRTKQHGASMSSEEVGALTLKEETIDDAVAAVELLRKQAEVDAARIFVLGHSLGGTAIPRIAKADAKIRGFVVMAGATRPLEDLVLEQVRYIANSDGELSDEEKDAIATIEKQVARAKALKPGDETPASELPLGAHAKYLLDLKANPPATLIKGEKRPLLVLQGERDYQVTLEDLAGWKKALEGHKDATLKSYPKLNHLFMAGEGKSTPTEYEEPGHVDVEVIDDVAKWLDAH